MSFPFNGQPSRFPSGAGNPSRLPPGVQGSRQTGMPRPSQSVSSMQTSQVQPGQTSMTRPPMNAMMMNMMMNMMKQNPNVDKDWVDFCLPRMMV